MIDAEAIARAAYLLAHHLDRIDSIKHANPKLPEVRIMKPGFGPTTPGNSQAIDADYTIWLELRAWTHTLGLAHADTTKPPADAATADHARWVAMTARWIADNPDVDAFLDDLHRWLAIAQQVTGRESARDTARRAQQSTLLLTAAHAAKIATAFTGKQVTRKQVTYFGKAGYIPTHHDARGKNCYKVSDILDYLQGKG